MTEKSAPAEHRQHGIVFFLLVATKHGLQLVQKATAFLIVFIAAFLFKLAQQIFLLLAEIFGNLHRDTDVLIALDVGIQAGDSPSLQLKDIAGLSALVDLITDLAVQCGNNDLATQRCLDEGDGKFAPDIVTAPLKDGVGTNPNLHDQIAGRTAIGPGIAMTANAHDLPVIDPGGDIDLNLMLLADTSGSATDTAGGFDDLTRTAAFIAVVLGLHHTEGGTLTHRYLTGTVTGGTGFGRGSLRRTTAITLRTAVHTKISNFFFATLGRFFETNGHTDLGIGTATGSIGIGTALTAEAAKSTTKNTAKNIVNIDPCAITVTTGTRAEVGVNTSVAKLVVPGTFFRVRENLVGLIDLFELLLGFFVPVIQVGMIYLCQFTVSFFQFILGGVFRYAHNFIVIAFFCHWSSTPVEIKVKTT